MFQPRSSFFSGRTAHTARNAKSPLFPGDRPGLTIAFRDGEVRTIENPIHSQFTNVNESNRHGRRALKSTFGKPNTTSTLPWTTLQMDRANMNVQTKLGNEYQIEERQSVVKEPSKNLSNRFKNESLDFELRM